MDIAYPDDRRRAESPCSRAAFSAVELAAEALRFAEAENPQTDAYLHFSPERALAKARAWMSALRRGEDPGPLAGVPVAVKDVIVTKGVRTTCGSRLLADYIPPYDATAIVRLEEAGGVILGKTNCDEFAMGSSNENSAFGPVRNPVALDRVPGGSSGGSAAAVAQGTAVVALGSDTGGSIRQPASFCGVVGVTPTYGRVSRYGLTAFASSLDHIGPFAPHGEGCRARCCGVIAGRDAVRCHLGRRAGAGLRGRARRQRKRLEAWAAARVSKGLDERNRRSRSHAAIGRARRSWAARCARSACPHTDYAIACYYIIATAEASSNLARYDGVRYTYRSPNSETLSDMYRNTRGEGFGAECKRRIMLGTYVLSAGYYDAYYLKAQKVRALIARDFAKAFQRGGRDRGAGLAVPGVQARREGGRSDGHVPVRHLHHHRRAWRAFRA